MFATAHLSRGYAGSAEPVRAHVDSRSLGGVLLQSVSLFPGLLAARYHGLVIKVAPSISVIQLEVAPLLQLLLVQGGARRVVIHLHRAAGRRAAIPGLLRATVPRALARLSPQVGVLH